MCLGMRTNTEDDPVHHHLSRSDNYMKKSNSSKCPRTWGTARQADRELRPHLLKQGKGIKKLAPEWRTRMTKRGGGVRFYELSGFLLACF